MTDQSRIDDRDEILFAFHRTCGKPTAEQILDWVKRFPQFGDDIRAHAGILSDWAGRENLPMKEPEEAMLNQSRIRVWNALYNAEAARKSEDVAASPRSAPASHELEQPASTASAIAADDQGGPPDRGPEVTSPVRDPSRYQQSKWALVAAAVALSVAYAPNFRDLLSVWEADPNYSHGYLIIPIALVILWRRLSDKPVTERPTWVGQRWWGWIVLGAVLALRAIAYERASQWVETATILPVIACLTWTLGGWPLVRVAWPAILFLIFLFPLPPGVNDSVALPLQRIAATGSCFLLQLTGLWAVQEGNVIHLATPHGDVPLDVALACNGLRMLMTMAATITAVIVLITKPTWQRLTLLASTVPIALLSNMVRIVVTGWCFYLFTGAEAKHWAHDVSGWLMMPLALALVGLELALMSWLAPTAKGEGDEDEQVILPVLYERKSGKEKKKGEALDELV